MTCTACSGYPALCNITFRCSVCLQTLNSCASRVGGFEAKENICVACHYDRQVGQGEYALLSKKFKNPKGGPRCLRVHHPRSAPSSAVSGF